MREREGTSYNNKTYFEFKLAIYNLISQAILPCIHVDRETIAVMVLTKGINRF
jgi:hypothetical protein